MPVLSIFYGVIIRMYFFDNKEHHVPHIHAEYSGDLAVYAIENGECLAGALPANKERLVQAWIEIHKEDLNANWSLAIQGQQVFKINPLQ